MPNEKEVLGGSGGGVFVKGRQRGRGVRGNGRGGSETWGRGQGNESGGSGKGRGGRGRGQGQGSQLEPVAGPSSRSYEDEILALRKAKACTKKVLASLDPAVRKELDARKRTKQLSRSLLPDAPPRKRQKKSSPERALCRLTPGTPSTPPAPKLQPWQIRKQLTNAANTGDVEVERECLTPVSSISIADSSAVSELLVDFTSGLLKSEVGNFLCLPVTDALPQQHSEPIPTLVAQVGEAPQVQVQVQETNQQKINLGCDTIKHKVIEKWLDMVESDDDVDEVDVTDAETDEHMPVHQRLTPTHIFEDDESDTDLRTWLTNNDKDSDRLLTELIPTDHLTFDWVEDHNNFRGKREIFKGIAGPTFPVTEDMTPLDIFLKFFDDELFDLLTVQTNKYATRQIDQHNTAHSRLNFFVNVDRDEMARFLAILILQGLLPSPVEKSYWGDNGYLTLPYIKQIMTYNRFILLKRLLHFSDSNDSQTLPTDDKKLWKIQPVLNLLQKKFSSLYLPQQEVAIDESLLKWKGRLSFAQRIASKAARVGVKSYELCESSTGYLWRFFVYTGKTKEQTDKTDALTDELAEDLTDGQIVDLTDGRTDGPTDTPPLLPNATSKIVHGLMEPLYNRGHTLIMDNFYNSPLLARYLKSQGTDCFGTLRVNREFVPEALKTVPKYELREGEFVQSFTHDLSVVMLRDANVVSLLSTYHDGVVGGTEKYGRYKYKPQVILDYNKAMGGVDRKDQLLSAFPIERVRNIVWYKKVFRRLLNITLMNAHIIFQTRHKRCSPRDFRRQVAEGLFKMSQPPKIERSIQVSTIKHALARKPNKVRPILKGNHFIGEGPSKKARCEWCKQSRTMYICKQCGVSLCLQICFEEYHTVP